MKIYLRRTSRHNLGKYLEKHPDYWVKYGQRSQIHTNLGVFSMKKTGLIY